MFELHTVMKISACGVGAQPLLVVGARIGKCGYFESQHWGFFLFLTKESYIFKDILLHEQTCVFFFFFKLIYVTKHTKPK